MRVAIYSRVSTNVQDNENQLAQLRKYCYGHGHKIVQEYVDTCSGANEKRPQFDQMFKDAEHKRFELVLFWSLDRFSRQGIGKTIDHLNRLTKLGIAYRSHKEEGLDTTTAFGEFLISIFAYLAKQERLRITERVRAGLDRARTQGRVGGRPKALKPYQLETAQKMRDEGRSWSYIAKQFNCHLDTIKRALGIAR